MITLNERLTKAFNILIENAVFLIKYNKDAYCKFPDDEQLQFVTNYLSVSDVKLMLSVCEIYSLEFGINYVPSSNHNYVCVIFRDKDSNHG